MEHRLHPPRFMDPLDRNAPLWVMDAAPRPFDILKGDIRVDVAIVGAGLTGLTLAHLLGQKGINVAVLESRRIGSGVSGRTTAHLTEAVDTRYHGLARDFGKDGARLVAQSSHAAIDRIEDFVRRLGVRCGFRRLPGFLYTESKDGLAQLHEEYEAAKEAGLDVTLTTGAPLPFPIAAAIRFEGQAQLEPACYLKALADSVRHMGCRIFEGSPVVRIEDGSPCSVQTQEGTVFCDQVVSATHSPLTRFFAQTKIASYRSYVVAFESEASVGDGLFWDTADPYHYIRRADIRGRSYLIVGGEDHKTGQVEDTDSAYGRLSHYARERWGATEIPYHWSAQVCEPYDGLPYIGRSWSHPHVWIATGYSGNGTTFGTIAAMILADRLRGRPNEWSNLYDASRRRLIHAKDYIAENIDFPTYLVKDRLRGADAHSFAEVSAGDGKIVRLQGKKLAVYRDDHGQIHALSPICPHLGCQVHFNHAERTWDCPCHGSRFDVRGQVLHGPSLQGLAQVDLGGPKEGGAFAEPEEVPALNER